MGSWKGEGGEGREECCDGVVIRPAVDWAKYPPYKEKRRGDEEIDSHEKEAEKDTKRMNWRNSRGVGVLSRVYNRLLNRGSYLRPKQRDNPRAKAPKKRLEKFSS